MARLPSNAPCPPDGTSTVDVFADRLRRAGWSVAEVQTALGWRVTGTRRGTLIETTAPTHLEAWRRACDQAAAAGMLGPEG